MRLLSFTPPKSDTVEWGLQIGDRVYSGTSIAPTLDDFIWMGRPAPDELKNIASPGRAVSEIRIEAPLRRPGKVIAIGQNYMDHCRECNVPLATL
jgi:2-keto-4-pentenoate hydratase/2-oxohepta-3-ene-1,7-dioic acid hydratase in catechol pathway